MWSLHASVADPPLAVLLEENKVMVQPTRDFSERSLMILVYFLKQVPYALSTILLPSATPTQLRAVSPGRFQNRKKRGE